MFAIMPMETEGHGREFGRRQKMRAKCTVEFVCKYCQRRFTKPYNLMIHERSHKDDVTFTCEVCGKSFKRQDNFKQHRCGWR
ncbi:protein drumstick isoform X2 [Solenopsis invicta]|uniref:protein drumstick isoform X2 n=1 Tax=Solenopsis invicta TaxID=13686 RepID=UPI000595FFF1|nr:protein drumstick isoform X2 [Solenopsis invicta]